MSKTRRHHYKRVWPVVLLTAVLTSAVLVGGFFGIQALMTHKAASVKVKKPAVSQLTKPSADAPTIYPTLYMTGSSGTPTPNISKMVAGITANNNNPAKNSLTLIVETKNNYQVKATGELKAGNLYPAIVVGMDVGTNTHQIYSDALTAVMDYLDSRYHIPSYNLCGYSSAGGGGLQFLMANGSDSKLPPCKKFLALDGEFNMESPLQAGETLADVLADGPRTKTGDYLWFQSHYQDMPKGTEVALLGAEWNGNAKKPDSDGSIPWADLFSTYNLLKKNGNKVVYDLHPSAYPHWAEWEDPIAVSYIEQYFYGDLD